MLSKSKKTVFYSISI